MVTDEKAPGKSETTTPAAVQRQPLFTMTGWIVVIGICVLEGVIFTLVGAMVKKPEGDRAKANEVRIAYWTLEPAFRVTIVTEDGLFHAFETKIALGMDKDTWDDEKEKKKLTERTAKLRDTILTELQKQSWPDVMRVDGQARLRKDLLSALEGVVGKNVIQEICFESFSPQ